MQTEIHIFKTNIITSEQIKNANAFLSTHSKIEKWNIDLDDCDKVLRIETSQLLINDVIESLAPFNIHCEALE